MAKALLRGGARWRAEKGSRGEAVGVAGGVAALQPDLVRSAAAECVALEEEPLVERDPAALAHVELGHPGAHAVRVELVVPRTVQRVGEVDALAVAANLDHLRPAAQRLARPGRVRRAPDDAAGAHRPGLPRGERGGGVVVLHLAGAPARDGERLVVDREGAGGEPRR